MFVCYNHDLVTFTTDDNEIFRNRPFPGIFTRFSSESLTELHLGTDYNRIYLSIL